MQNPLFWIEWLDRLDRVLSSARQDIAVLKRAVSPRSLEAIGRSKRQLAALINDLRLLDPDVLAAAAQIQAAPDALQSALEATVAKLGSLAEIPAASAPGVLDACWRQATPHCAIAATKRRCCLQPHRRRA